MQQAYAGDSPLAVCFLGKESDPDNQCSLSPKFLIVKKKGKSTIFPLEDISEISLHRKKMMLPLITGGIFAPLSLIAVAKNLFEPWGILIWIIINLFLIYFGWIGYWVLTVSSHAIQQDITISRSGENIKAFIKFTNEYLQTKPNMQKSVSSLFHIVKAKEWNEAKADMKYAPSSLNSEGFIHLSTKEQVPVVMERYYKNETGLVLLHIDSLKLKAELKYEPVHEGEALYPHLYGPLNLDAVLKEEPLG